MLNQCAQAPDDWRAATSIHTLVYSRERLQRSGLSALLSREPDIEVVAETGSTRSIRRLSSQVKADVVVASEPLTAATVEFARAVASRDEARPTPVVLLTDVAGDAAAGTGAIPGCAVLSGSIDPLQLVAAVRLVAAGYLPLDARLVSRFASFLKLPSAPGREEGGESTEDACLGRLTSREGDVLVLVAHGLSNCEIAQALSVAESTVKTHVRGILQKLDLRDRVQVAVFAYRSGLVAV